MTHVEKLNITKEKVPRQVRSFVLRQSRISNAQQQALQDNWHLFGLENRAEFLQWHQLFEAPDSPIILEIGFGNGHSLARMAYDYPENNYIGIEVHRPGVGALLLEIARLNLNNVRCFQRDALEVLKQNIPDNSLQAVQLFFPDPWQKKRHYKRRIVKTEFLDLIASKLKDEGRFHMATDWQDYAEDAMNLLSEHPRFKNSVGNRNFSERPAYRTKTKFEMRGEALGHGVWDLVFEKA